MTRPSWFDYDRPEEFEGVVIAVDVPLRNGLTLAGDLALPGRGTEVTAGRFPCLVVHYTPYGKGLRTTTLEWWARHGYAAICCDVRGTQASPGVFPEPASAGENEDNYDLIEWLAVQPFSNGKVGQYGQSYGALTSLRVASLRPPHLAAIAPQQSWSSYYDYKYPGGIEAGRGGVWPDAVPEFTHGRMASDWLQALWSFHPLLDDFWRQTDIDAKYDEIGIPSLLYGGWFDLFKEGMVENFQGLRERSYFVAGPWTHGNPEEMENEPATLGMLLAWFDHWLAGLDAPLPSARVTSYEVPRATSAGWQEFEDFPPPCAQSWRLHFNSDGALRERVGTRGSRSYTVDPTDGPVMPKEGTSGLLPDDDEADQSPRDNARLFFETPPLQRDVVVVGSPLVHMSAALGAEDGYFIVHLMDASPEGKVKHVSTGCLRATHRLGHDRIATVSPEIWTSYTVVIEPVHWRFKVGHRLRVSLTSGYVPVLVADAPPGDVRVATGDGGSYADFQVLRG